MLKLIVKLCLILFIVLVLNVVLLMTPFPLEQKILPAAILDKRELLKSHAPGTIIVVGGSSVPFGYDSAYLQSLTGKPVINVGLHSGLGLRYMLDGVLPFVKENDMVILALEYDHYHTSPDYRNSQTLRRVVGINFHENVPYMRTLEQWRMIMTFHPEMTVQLLWFALKGGRGACPGDTYCRESFNELGDIKDEFNTSTEKSRRDFESESGRGVAIGYLPEVDDNALTLLNSFADEVRVRNAEVYIVFPPFPEKLMVNFAPGVQGLFDQMEGRLNVPILGEPLSYPDDHFYDTRYHLNNEGRQVHMAHIADLIMQAMNP